jgi:hypothetical protein
LSDPTEFVTCCEIRDPPPKPEGGSEQRDQENVSKQSIRPEIVVNPVSNPVELRKNSERHLVDPVMAQIDKSTESAIVSGADRLFDKLARK